MMDDLDLVILVEGDERMFNQYGVIKVNPEKHEGINKKGADRFVEWIISDEVRKRYPSLERMNTGKPVRSKRRIGRISMENILGF